MGIETTVEPSAQSSQTSLVGVNIGNTNPFLTFSPPRKIGMPFIKPCDISQLELDIVIYKDLLQPLGYRGP